MFVSRSLVVIALMWAGCGSDYSVNLELGGVQKAL
jgi:hypothetical protein